MELEYTVVYSDRKTLAVCVERDRSVIVRAPRQTSREALEHVVESKKLWLWQKMQHAQKYDPSLRSRELVSGTSLLYLGQEYRLDVVPEEFEGVQLDGTVRLPRASLPYAREVLRAWYRQEAQQHIPPRVEFYAAHLGVQYSRILISDLKFRWGSCTPGNTLNFNWRLIKAPMPVIEYVVVHELAHLLELNHTPQFWSIVRTQRPDYLKAKAWLKQHGGLLEEQV
jgi:predicted metal-dependent hydrolase